MIDLTVHRFTRNVSHESFRHRSSQLFKLISVKPRAAFFLVVVASSYQAKALYSSAI